MADTKISALTALAGGSVATGDLFVTVDVSDTTMASSGTDKRLTVSSLGTALTGLALVETPGAAAAAQAASQPLDADLTSIAALTTTSYGRSLLTLANAAALVSTAGLDADLATFVVPASTTISTYGATLVDDADAATARTTLGLGTAAVLSSTVGGDLSGTLPNPTVVAGRVNFTVGSPVLGAGYGINSTTGIATEQASLGLLFYGTQWAGAATIDLRRINGTSGSPAALASGDVIGGMHIGGSITTSNTGLDDVAQIYCIATENYASGASGNRWDFYVNKNSSGVASATSKTVAFRVDQDGSIDAGFGTYGAVTAATWSVSNTGAETAASATIGTMTVGATGNVAGVGTFATTNNWTQTRSAGTPQVLIRRDDAAATAVNINVGQWVMGGVTAASTFINTASMAAVSESAYVTANNAPTQIRFMTTSATASLVNRVIFDSSGSVHVAPSVSAGLVTNSTFTVKSDGSLWVAPSVYTSNQPSAAAATIAATGAATFYGTGPVTLVSGYDMVDIANGVNITHNGASMTAVGTFVAPTVSYSTAPAGAFGWRGFQDASTHQNTSGSAAVLAGTYVSFEATPTLKTTSANANTLSTYVGFRSLPVLAGTASGVLTVTTLVQQSASAITVPANVTVSTLNQISISGPAVSASGTCTTRRGINIADGSNAGTYTTNIGIDIAAHTAGGTTNLGIRTFADILVSAANIQTDTSTGMKIGTATTQKLGFFNATPIVQGTAFTQNYVTTTHTHNIFTAAASAPVGGTGTAAGGWDTAVNRDLAITFMNALRADLANTKSVLTALIDDLQALGLIA